MAAISVARAATAVTLVLCAVAACGQVMPAARGFDGPGDRPGGGPRLAAQATTDSSLIPLGPLQGTLDEAAGQRLTSWLTVIVLAGAGRDAAGDPQARANRHARWASRVWLRTAGSSTRGRVSVDVYADVTARERGQREAAAGTPYLITGPLWTVTTSSADDEDLVRGYLVGASARTIPTRP